MKRSPYYHNPGRCVVCREPGTRRLPEDDPHCGQPICHLELRRSPQAARCRICRVLLRPNEYARGICNDPQCTIRDGAREAEARRQTQLKRMHELLGEHVGQYAEEHGISSTDVLSAVVPVNDNDLHPSDAMRKTYLERHLNDQVEEARSILVAGDAPVLDDPDNGPNLDRSLSVCAACWGGCCMTGGNHGYITPQTLARYAALTEQDVDGLVELYSDRVPETSYANSCIFHGPVGCGLDRDMRSDTCNHHLCAGLKGLQGRMRGRENDAIVVIGSDKGRHVRTIIVEPKGAL